MKFTRRSLFVAAALAATIAMPASAQDKFIIVSSTTSTQDSGLFGLILPIFKARTGIEVRVVAQGTGQALDTGKRGDADVVFVHDKAAEEKFVADGFSTERREVMYNDFVLIGPKSDPAMVAGSKDISSSLKTIAEAKARFASRGDKSGTNAAELRLWRVAAVDVEKDKGSWYRELGQGMGPTLNTAAAMNAYVLADRATWLNFKNRADLAIVVEGDQRLFNQYGIMLVNPAKHAHVREDMGMTFIDWVTSPEGQKAIADYKINGEQLFFPNYRRAARAASLNARADGRGASPG